MTHLGLQRVRRAEKLLETIPSKRVFHEEIAITCTYSFQNCHKWQRLLDIPTPLSKPSSSPDISNHALIMAKKKSGPAASKAAVKAAKKAKANQKVEKREKKKSTKSKDVEDDDQDLEGILDKVPSFSSVFQQP